VKFGTPHYMSPERLREGRANEHDDMWALGVILYEILSGHRPYSKLEGEYPYAELCTAIETNAPREPMPASCPPDLMAIVHKLLNHQLERRYPHAGAIKNDLNAFLRGTSTKALSELATPETIKATPEPAPPRTPSALNAVPPTTPLPGGGSDPHRPEVGASVATATPARPLPRQPLIRRVTWAVALLLLTTLFTMEAVAWVGAERMRAELTALDGRQLTRKRQDYQRLQRWSLLHLGPRLRLDGPLKDHLVSVAGAVITDYGQEEPTVAEVQWRQASDALAWASQLSPYDRRTEPKKLVCDGHLDRIAAQSRMRTNLAEAQQIFREAIAKFQQAARLDTQSADPYLGLSRIYIYGLGDVDLGAASIREAENRGHKAGWRESAQLGDGYLRRGDKQRRAAGVLHGEPRRQTMEGVRDDYARCVQYFTPIVGHGKAKANLVYCQKQLDAVDRDLAAEVTEQVQEEIKEQ
jgi:eukaryotic-like serine/threonine-protein kinase